MQRLEERMRWKCPLACAYLFTHFFFIINLNKRRDPPFILQIYLEWGLVMRECFSHCFVHFSLPTLS